MAFSLLTACTDPPPPALNSQDRQIIDSLYRLRVDSLRPKLDSICDGKFEARVEQAVDSMYKLRVAEMERLIKRLKEKEQQ
jgi:hypothetical protein